MTDTSTDTPRVDRLIYLDPNTVAVHPNVRHDLGDLADLTRSVKAIGVRVPTVVVRGQGDEYLLLLGQRRHAAAIAAGRPLPALVTDDVDEAERIVSQLAENQYRKDLTPSQEGGAYEQLSVLGLSDAAIAKRTGTTKRRVQSARQVAGSEVASAVAHRYALDLEQAAVVAEFGDDAEAVKTLTVAAKESPGQFPHVASRLRQDRERTQQRMAAVEALAAAGVTVLESSSDNPAATALWNLCDGEDDAEITPEAHSACPGHAAVVPEHTPDRPRYFCLDPDAYGHRNRYANSRRPAGGAMTDEQKVERRLVVENNKQWRAAEPVRREYVRGLLTRKAAPKGTLRYAVGEVMAAPERVGDGKDEMLAALLGAEAERGWGRRVGPAHAARASEARLPLVLLAQVSADREQTMDVHTWRRRDQAAARYLSFLASTGYQLSDIEQQVVNEGSADQGADTGDRHDNGQDDPWTDDAELEDDDSA